MIQNIVTSGAKALILNSPESARLNRLRKNSSRTGRAHVRRWSAYTFSAA